MTDHEHEALARRKFDDAMDRLDAEVAAHEPPTFPNPDFYGDGEQHGAAFGEPAMAPEPAAPAEEKEPRFGNRLRAQGAFRESERMGLADLADAIDRDEEWLREMIGEHRDIAAGFERKLRDLRWQVEEAVERLAFVVETDEGPRSTLAAEAFLLELDRIFGERRAAEGAEIIRAALGWCVTQGADEQADILRKACLVYLKSQPAVSYEDRHRNDKEEVGGAIYEAALAANQTTREICQRCHTVSAIGFHAPTETWRAVAGRDWANSILCIRCFAALGDEKFIAWERGLAFYPVSYASHHTERFGRSVP